MCEGSNCVQNATHLAPNIAQTYSAERQGLLAAVQNSGATNTIDAALKRVLILQETVRDFAIRVLPLRLFSTVFSAVPLEGAATVEVPYYPLQTTVSSDFTDGDGTAGSGYQFGQATSTSKKEIVVNKRKYQPLDYSSNEFRRQPWFNALRLSQMNMERLGIDIITDILSVIKAAAYGAPVKSIGAGNYTSDDVVDLRGIANGLYWPDIGRALIVDSSIDNALQKDNAYKLALNIGTNSVIQQGQFPNLSGFDYAWMPSFPANGEGTLGVMAFASAILSAFAPIDPAPGVRSQLVAYNVATDPATGISLNYRHWGLAQADRDYEVIECAYGYAAGVPNALRRLA